MIVLGTVRTPDQRGTRFLAGNTPEERAELAYNTQVLLSKIKLFGSKDVYGKKNNIEGLKEQEAIREAMEGGAKN